jgi:hypothetical protein
LSLPGLAAPYIDAGVLDQRPRFVTQLPDVVPFGLVGDSGGTIRFVLYISELGQIDRIETQASAGLEYAARYLEQLIRANEIRPGAKKGRPARARWTLEFTLTPGGGAVQAAEPDEF